MLVRYDAQKKRDHFIADTLGRHFSWSPICPEVEIGLGVPRPKIQLEHVVEDKDKNAGVDFRLTIPEKNRDLTRKMLGHCRRLVRRLAAEGVCGCLLKSRSPSCGMSRVKAYMSDGRMRRDGVGFFAATVQKMLPELPVEEDERFGDAAVRENWIERVFAYDRLQRLFAGPCKPADLEAFHRAHRLALQSHDPKAYGQLSRLLESPRNARLTAGLQRQYASAIMASMRRPGHTIATRGRVARDSHRARRATRRPGISASDRACRGVSSRAHAAGRGYSAAGPFCRDS